MDKRLVFLSGLICLALIAGCGCNREAPEAGEAAVPEPKEPLASRTIHIFCYHGVQKDPSNFYHTRTSDFKEQMQMLKDEGYESISTAQLADYLAGDEDIPEKSVLISFDDGKGIVYDNACPILEEFGYTATLFINSSTIGGDGFMTWEELSELNERGYDIAAHTCNHENLIKREGKAESEYEQMVNSELRDCKAAIEEHVDTDCIGLAYPYGTYTDYVVDATKDAGYRLGFTIDRGAADDRSHPYRLPRQMVVRDNSMRTFERWLRQEPLHIEDLQPPVGKVVSSKDVTITGRIADGISMSGLQLVDGGSDPSFEVSEETSEFSLDTTLQEGANNIRLQYAGTPSREISWVVVSRPE